MKSAHKKNRGFTLIEMIIAIFIISVGLMGTLSFLNVNSANQTETKNELIAAGLAQEGTELARNIRDYNLLNGKAWDMGLASTCKTIDYGSLGNTHACGDDSNKIYVCLSAASNFRYYQCASGADGNTGFTRNISLDTSHKAADGYIIIKCTVIWNGRTTTAQDFLYSNNY